MTVRFAAIIDGPDWWATSTLARTGSAVDLTNTPVYLARKQEAAIERVVLGLELAALPEGTWVLHSGDRGAIGSVIAQLRTEDVASIRGSKGNGESATRQLLVDGLVALREAGWKVKARLAGSPDDNVAIAALLAEQKITVRYFEPVLPEPESDPADAPEGDEPAPDAGP